jgi:hypothetical protein
MAIERAPGNADSANSLNYGKDGLGEDPSKGPMMIGGTHNVSVRINPDTALSGGYTPIPGDDMPAGAPAVGPGTDAPYTPKN